MRSAPLSVFTQFVFVSHVFSGGSIHVILRYGFQLDKHSCLSGGLQFIALFLSQSNSGSCSVYGEWIYDDVCMLTLIAPSICVCNQQVRLLCCWIVHGQPLWSSRKAPEISSASRWTVPDSNAFSVRAATSWSATSTSTSRTPSPTSKTRRTAEPGSRGFVAVYGGVVCVTECSVLGYWIGNWLQYDW